MNKVAIRVGILVLLAGGAWAAWAVFQSLPSRQTEIAEDDYDILVGPKNDEITKKEVHQADKVIIAWGKPRGVFFRHYQRRIKKLVELLDGIKLHRVGELSHGQ